MDIIFTVQKKLSLWDFNNCPTCDSQSQNEDFSLINQRLILSLYFSKGHFENFVIYFIVHLRLTAGIQPKYLQCI